MAGNELLALIRGLALFLEKRRLLRFASDTLKIRNFQMKNQREMAVDVYYNVYIYTAQVRPFLYERVRLVLHTYIPCWRRRVLLLLFLFFKGS